MGIGLTGRRRQWVSMLFVSHRRTLLASSLCRGVWSLDFFFQGGWRGSTAIEEAGNGEDRTGTLQSFIALSPKP